MRSLPDSVVSDDLTVDDLVTDALRLLTMADTGAMSDAETTHAPPATATMTHTATRPRANRWVRST